MSRPIGEQAIVIGAGIGGITAARVLSDFFTRVLVLERDTLPTQAVQRTGIPQGRHVHVLLGGGQRALESLFPGFERDLEAAGAVRYRAGLDIRVERPGFDPFPQRDLGWHGFAMSRPLVELTARRCLGRSPNVELRERCGVREIVADARGDVCGVRCEDVAGASEQLRADLVVDASGRGAPTLAFLESHGHALPQETAIGADMHYASAVFAKPSDAPHDWKAVITLANPPSGRRGGLLFPLENGRWILSTGGAHGDTPPGDGEGFVHFVQGLRTPTIAAALRGAERVGDIVRFAFPESRRRHFERLTSFPRGLVPLADSICRFNPIYGQGMSVAAQQACALRDLLARLADEDDAPLARLAPAFFAAAASLIETPWAVAMLDLVYPQTSGERPADFATTLAFGAALARVAARDPEMHKLMLEVQHLIRPRSAYREPAILQRIAAEMSTA